MHAERRELIEALAAYYGRDTLSLVSSAVSASAEELRLSNADSVSREWMLDFGLLIAQAMYMYVGVDAQAGDRLGTEYGRR